MRGLVGDVMLGLLALALVLLLLVVPGAEGSLAHSAARARRGSVYMGAATTTAAAAAAAAAAAEGAAGSSPRLIIAGAPAAGKGTQCETIKSTFGVVHLSTGDILRAAVKAGTPLGVKAKGFMDAGQLVPDELITNVVCDRLKQEDCKSQGWLLDGFPRTRAQADALSAAGFKPDSFILLDVPESILVERVTGRRTDPETGAIYHLKFKPPPEDDAALKARLVQRSDDTEEKIVVRYREFAAHVESVKASYSDRVVWVDGSLPADAVSRCLLDAVQQKLSAEAVARSIRA